MTTAAIISFIMAVMCFMAIFPTGWLCYKSGCIHLGFLTTIFVIGFFGFGASAIKLLL